MIQAFSNLFIRQTYVATKNNLLLLVSNMLLLCRIKLCYITNSRYLRSFSLFQTLLSILVTKQVCKLKNLRNLILSQHLNNYIGGVGEYKKGEDSYIRYRIFHNKNILFNSLFRIVSLSFMTRNNTVKRMYLYDNFSWLPFVALPLNFQNTKHAIKATSNKKRTNFCNINLSIVRSNCTVRSM